MRRALLRHASQNLATQVIASIAAVVGSAVISRTLGPRATGEYSLATFSALTIVTVFTLGLPTAVIRYIAEARARADADQSTRIIGSALRFSLLAGSLLTALGIVLLAAGVRAGFSLAVGVVILLTIVPSMAGAVFASALSARQQFGSLLRINAALAAAQLALTAVAGILGAGVLVFVLIFAVGVLLQCALTLRLWGEPVSLRHRLEGAVRSRFWRDTSSLSALGVINTVVFQRSEVFFLAALSSRSQIAYYTLAFALISRGLLLLPGAITGVLLPKFAGVADPSSTLGVSTRWLGLVTIPLVVMSVALASPIIQVLYGAAFAPAAPVLRVVAVASGVTVLITGGSSAMVAQGRQNVMLAVGAVGAVVNLALAYVWTKSGGALGAAFAGGVAQALCVGGGVIYLERVLKLRLPWGALGRTVLASILAGACATAATALPVAPLIQLLVGGVTAAIAYLTGLLMTRALPADEAAFLTSRFSLSR